MSVNIRTGTFLKAIAAAALPTLAFALAPLASPAQDVPSYATRAGASGETIHGTIAAIPGKYTLIVADDRGFSDSVTLREGTIVEPDGITLEVGQAVTIVGKADGKTFDADEIDTDGADVEGAAPDAGGFYASPYLDGGYPPYVIPLGGGGYYYGSGYGGTYYSNSGYGGAYYGPHGSGPIGNPRPALPHGPGSPPIVRGHGFATPARSSGGSGHGSGASRR